jgi:sugar O-acyltransferase (sialic acid O-acetyltransferase NeuD family)
MSRNVVLFGTGDFARIADVYLTRDSPFEVVAFTVNREFLAQTGPEWRGKPVAAFEDLERTHPPETHSMFVAIGFSRVNKARAEVYHQCKAKGYELIRYMCSEATCWGDVEIGDNTFIFENNVIQPFVRIGSDVVLWSGNHIGHDTTIGDHCFIASHAVISGRVQVGGYSFIGVNATIRDGVKIGPESVIGAGALVTSDTPAQAVFKGRAGELSPVPSWRLKAL